MLERANQYQSFASCYIYLLEYLSTCYILLSYVHANENIKFNHGQNNLSELNVQEVPPAPESVLQSSPPPEQCLEWVLGYSRESCTLTCSRVSHLRLCAATGCDLPRILQSGAVPESIVWQVAGAVTLGTTSHFEGVIFIQDRHPHDDR